MRYLLTLALLTAVAMPAWGDERLPPIRNDAVTKECGACHMAFQPQLLPRQSWAKIMGDLQNHFGEDASLPEATRAEIAKYLDANAADVGRSRIGNAMARSIGNGPAPLRITEVPLWKRVHWEVPDRIWSDPRVRSRANCEACHRGAGFGVFEDD